MIVVFAVVFVADNVALNIVDVITFLSIDVRERNNYNGVLRHLWNNGTYVKYTYIQYVKEKTKERYDIV